MKITDLPIPLALKEFYIRDKITSLYPPQIEVVKKGLFDNKNLLISIPTASGKTLMAEMAMLASIIDHQGKALYVVPLKALASEKYHRFCKFEELGMFNGEKIKTTMSTGDFKSKGETLAESDIIVVTSEKMDSLIRNKAPWLGKVSIVVIDEIHLVGDPERGATLEMVIAKLRRINSNLVFIGLSATIGNPENLASWLNAELIVSEWRPTKLDEGVFYNDQIQFADKVRNINYHAKDNSHALVMDMVSEGGQCLVFCSSRKQAESKARKIASRLIKILNDESRSKLQTVSDKIKDIADKNESESTAELANMVSCGSAYHHAGIVEEIKNIIEDEFRAGIIKVIFCTPTLAAGINMPARRVIIPGYKRYNINLDGMEYIRVMDYKQMAGRAGRPHLDPYGECVLVPGEKDTEEDADDLAEIYIHGRPESIDSNLLAPKHLRMHALASIASEFVNTVDDLNKLFNETFLKHQPQIFDVSFIKRQIYDALNYLIQERMVDVNGGILSATNLGKIVSRLCLNPTTAALIVKGFHEIDTTDIKLTDMTLLHLISLTDDVDTDRHIKRSDAYAITDVYNAHECELVKFNELIKLKKLDSIHTSIWNSNTISETVKIADILRMWINEYRESAIAECWNIAEGDVFSITEQSKRVMSALYDIAKLYENERVLKLARVLRVRVSEGINQELIGLIRIRGIGRIFSRRLYNAGIKSEQQYLKMKESNPDLVRSIMYPKKKTTGDIPTVLEVKKLPNGQKSFADY